MSINNNDFIKFAILPPIHSDRSSMLDILLPIALLASTAFTILLLCLPSRYNDEEAVKNDSKTTNGPVIPPKVSVQVLVLGDIGRSPRMQYHAMSIAKHGGKIDLVGYLDSPLYSNLQNNPLVTIHALAPQPKCITNLSKRGVPFLIVGPLKVLYQTYTLIRTLGYSTPASKYLLVQNPPSVPTLLVALIICFLRNTHLLIDWHNYGWTILSGTKGTSHPLTVLSKLYEQFLGRYAHASFTVTHAMKRQLQKAPYSVTTPIHTLHDRPADIFRPIFDPALREQFLARLPETAEFATQIMAGNTKLLVSSTSWTPDEDFGLLLDALVAYASATAEDVRLDLPALLVLVTGKGPQKELYLDKMEKLATEGRLPNTTIRTPWLTMEDYASVLASADLGVCLHMSSSGVDLPMKVVDMFGSGLPVVGYAGYESWPELVGEGENGRGFETAEELSVLLVGLFGDGQGRKELSVLREGAVREGLRRWDSEWDPVAGRLLGLCSAD